MSDPNAPQNPGQPVPPPAPDPAAPQYGQPAAPQFGQPAAPQQGQPVPPQYGQPAPAANAPYTPEQDKQWAAACHLGGILGPILPLIFWLLGKDRGPRTATEGKESLNWQITFLIGIIALSIVTTILTTSLIFSVPYSVIALINLLPTALWIVNVVFCVIGFTKVNGGGSYRYPVNFRFIK